MDLKDSKHIFHELVIGSLRLKNNLIAAPMAGLSSLPYRILAMENGCALTISEMISAEGIIRAHKKTKRYFANNDLARPFGVQLFSASANAMAEATKILEDEPIDLVDINMGCPVRKVISKGAGSALMGNLDNAQKIISATRRATKRPLTVKFRLGLDDESINCVGLAKLAQSEGADAVTIHGRTKAQHFKGKANWEYIGIAKESVKIPVIGNGDVKSRADAVMLIETTKCDGVMVGRAAIGNPWIFREILNENHPSPSNSELLNTAFRHLDMLVDFMGPKLAVLNMRTMLSWYLKGRRNVKKFMREAYSTAEVDDMKTMIRNFFGVSTAS